MHALLIAIIALLTQTAPASIEGVVLSSQTGEMLSRAEVELKPAEGSSGNIIVTSADGTFAFRNVPPGRYKLSATRPGYVAMEHKPIIAIGPGQRITNIRFSLIQTGAIYGRIIDGAGLPLANAVVRALKTSYVDGHRTLKTEQTAVTNDLGEYRLFWLAPGAYFVSALPYGTAEHVGVLTTGVDPRRESLGSVGTGSRGVPGVEGMRVSMMTSLILNKTAGALDPNKAYVATYFPGTTDQDRASVIDVRPGATAGSVDLTVSPIDRHHIRGIIINGITRQPAPQAQLRQARASAQEVCATRAIDPENCSFSYIDFDKGTFDLHVTPGSYILYAMQNDLAAQTLIEVRDADVENIVLALQPGITLTGLVVPPIAGVNVRLSPGPPVPGRDPLAGSTVLDGSFSVRGLTPGQYSVTVSGLKGSYVRSITAGGADVLNRGVRVTGQSDPPIQIELAVDTATIEGRILNAQGEPAIGVTVALTPDIARRNRADLYRNVETDASGYYKLNDVAPGEYKLFAWEDVEPGAWRNPDFMRLYEERGQRFRVNEGSVQRIEATVIRD